jgi:hypothetical protein
MKAASLRTAVVLFFLASAAWAAGPARAAPPAEQEARPQPDPSSPSIPITLPPLQPIYPETPSTESVGPIIGVVTFVLSLIAAVIGEVCRQQHGRANVWQSSSPPAAPPRRPRRWKRGIGFIFRDPDE